MNIKITKKAAGVRLDKFLTDLKSAVSSRNQIQKLIKAGLIKINGWPSSAHYFLKVGDKISVEKNTAVKKSSVKKKIINDHPVKAPEIINETPDFLIINKPAGLIVQGKTDNTLAGWIKAEYPGLKTVGDDPEERPGIVHRLDKDVSGLMAIAKTQDAYNHLKKQFQDRTIIKEYTALVYGQIKRDEGIINFPIKRSGDGYKMSAMPLTFRGKLSANGRQAETRFTIKEKLINYTLLKIKIITGRTHQIRVHLAAYDHPVVGDNIYGTAKTRLRNKKLGLNRIFLVADHLSFNDLNNNRLDYKINLTDELKNILKKVK
jgi:23S rRNA pseudouridine1911/1915/1917 synthase